MLKNDNTTLEIEQADMRDLTKQLAQRIEMGTQLDMYLPNTVENAEAAGENEEKIKFIKEEILFPLCHRLMVVNHHKYVRIYAYETDGFGNYNLMDDANSPSLLAMPYLGYCSREAELYQNTRRFILPEDNPYYNAGSRAAGMGSPHTPEGYVWHIGIIMQVLTSTDKKEIRNCLEMLPGTLMKQGFFDGEEM